MTPNENGDVDWDALYGMFYLLFYIFFSSETDFTEKVLIAIHMPRG